MLFTLRNLLKMKNMSNLETEKLDLLYFNDKNVSLIRNKENLTVEVEQIG